jgi:hypothetical protein
MSTRPLAIEGAAMRPLPMILTLFLVVRAGAAWASGVPITGVITDLEGHPLPGIMVFAANADDDKIESIAVSNDVGQVTFPATRARRNFGVVSTTRAVARLTSRGGAHFQLVLRPLPVSPRDQRALAAARIKTQNATLMRGRVVDEAGGGLPGSRLEAVRSGDEAATVATTASDRDGRFALGLPGGDYQLRVLAPGFRPARLSRSNGDLILVMAIAAEPQRIDIGQGHTLSFRIADSIDPEYTPPAAVRAWLLWAYNICPWAGAVPARERTAVKKYWYLDVLRTAPPSPATISTANCQPPSQYQRMFWSLGSDFVMLPDGFGYSPEDPGRERIDPPED